MSTLPSLHSATIDAMVDNAGRATLPFQRANREEHHATAFWFNELVESTGEEEVIRQYLVTAGESTEIKLAEFTLRADLCAPVMSAEKLVMADFAEGWTHLDDLGVAVMPTAGLHAHAVRKGWSWTTDEITDGLAATDEDIAALGESPVPAYLLGHVLDTGTGEREQAVVVGEVSRTGDGGVRWAGELPQGCVGAPVFVGARLGGDRFKLVCVGVALSGEGHHPIATFDRIRTSLRALAAHSDSDSAFAEDSRSVGPDRRGWHWREWRRRG
ncbi:hypothetical protein ACIP79_04140 [Streptomyces sp. NPDC088747]|uniref:hypothetical protein n=1 Tax=Streptomyces sp. NPDC088747 TaxID=3365886 RepID=UPI00380F7EEB